MITSRPHASEKIRHSADKPTLLKALREFLPEAALLSEREASAAFECDALSVHRCPPWIVALPENAAQRMRNLAGGKISLVKDFSLCPERSNLSRMHASMNGRPVVPAAIQNRKLSE